MSSVKDPGKRQAIPLPLAAVLGKINDAEKPGFSAAALAFLLLAATIVLYLIYARFMSFEKLYGEQR